MTASLASWFLFVLEADTNCLCQFTSPRYPALNFLIRRRQQSLPLGEGGAGDGKAGGDRRARLRGY